MKSAWHVTKNPSDMRALRWLGAFRASVILSCHYTQAHDAVVEALRLREAIPGVPEEDIADSMLTLGSILFAWRKYDSALPYLERACTSHMRIRGKFHISVGSSSYLLGAIYGKAIYVPKKFAAGTPGSNPTHLTTC